MKGSRLHEVVGVKWELETEGVCNEHGVETSEKGSRWIKEVFSVEWVLGVEVVEVVEVFNLFT